MFIKYCFTDLSLAIYGIYLLISLVVHQYRFILKLYYLKSAITAIQFSTIFKDTCNF